jgi:hypothetical protein
VDADRCDIDRGGYCGRVDDEVGSAKIDWCGDKRSYFLPSPTTCKYSFIRSINRIESAMIFSAVSLSIAAFAV